MLGTHSQGWQPPAWTGRGGEDRYQLVRPVVMAGQDSFASVFLLLGEQTGFFFSL